MKRNLRELRRSHSILDGGLFNVLNLVRLDPIVNTPGASRFDDKLHIRPLRLLAVEAQGAAEAVEYERVFSAPPCRSRWLYRNQGERGGSLRMELGACS